VIGAAAAARLVADGRATDDRGLDPILNPILSPPSPIVRAGHLEGCRLISTAKPIIASALGVAAALVLAGCGRSPHPAPPSPQDLALGSPTAPVTVIEYASVACPACADFNNAVFPAFRAGYVDTGKVRWILREALTGDTALAAAGFLTARCAGNGRYFSVVDQIFHAQSQMYASGQPQRVLLGIARRAGMSDAQFESCIADQPALAAMTARWRDDTQRQGIRRTPTFVVGDKVHEGEMTLQELQDAVGAARGDRT
jgi:protein-disulfide isomerase